MKCYAKDVVAFAKSQIGYMEKETNSNLESFKENAGGKNYNMYASLIDKTYPNFYNGKKNGFDWCDIFVDACFLLCYGYENTLKLLFQPENSCGAGCTYSCKYYKDNNAFSYYPKIGSQVFFSNDNGKTCYHTGIVCDVTDTHVTTIEGNSGNEVTEHIYPLSYNKIYGYGNPCYDVDTKKEWWKDAFNEAVTLGITDGTRADEPATRKEVAIMVLRAYKLCRKEDV